MESTESELFFSGQAERSVQYNARASVADFDACVREYAELSAEAKSRCPGLYDLHYGPAQAERLDLFPVVGDDQPSPLLVYIHGGYWRGQTKEDSAMMAETFTSAGVAVATIEYTLCPRASLFEIVREIRSAIAWLHQNGPMYGIDPSRIHVSGSSAGGHLVGMLLADDWQEEFGVPADVIAGGVALSGLFDLQPLCDIEPNEWLMLSFSQAKALSPLFLIPDKAPPLILAVGGLETDGFKKQTAAYAKAWRSKGHEPIIVDTPERNHFNLLSALSSADHPLTQAVLGMIKADP